MALLTSKFPILAKPVMGWLVIVLSLSSLLNIWAFQESTELPKLIVWYVGLAIAILISLYTGNLNKIRIPKTAVVLSLIFALLLVLGIFFTYDIRNTIFGLFPRYTSSVVFFLSWVLGIVFFTTQEKINVSSLFKLFGYLGFIVALWGIIQSFGIGFYYGTAVTVRNPAPSFLGNPNFSAMFVASALPILLSITFDKKKWSAYLHWFFTGISFVSLALFSSRGAFIATMVTILLSSILYAYKKSWKKALILIATLVIFTGIFGAYYFETRVNVAQTYYEQSNETVSSRLLLWDFTIEYIKNNPWFGTGLGNFFIAFRENTHPALTDQEWFDDVHNVFLQFAATTGIPTTLVFIFMIGYAAYVAIKKYSRSKDLDSPIAVFSAICMWCIAGLFTPVAMPLWVIMSVLIAQAWQMDGEEVDISNRFSTWIFLGTVSICILVIGTLMLVSELFLWQARRSMDHNDYTRSNSLSRISLSVFPLNTNALISQLHSELQLGQVENLDNNLQRLVSEHPRSSGLFLLAADYYIKSYTQTGNELYKKKAYDLFDKAIETNSNYVFPYRVTTINHIWLNDFAQALPFAKKAIVLSGDNFNSWMMYSKIQFELRNRTAVIRGLEKSYSIVPDFRIKSLLKQLKEELPLDQAIFPIAFK